MSSYEQKKRHLDELKRSFRYDFSESSDTTLREEVDSEPEMRRRRRNRRHSTTSLDQCVDSLCDLLKNWCRKICRPGQCWIHSFSLWLISFCLLKYALDYLLLKPQNIFVVI
ncbi:hypothetical protein BpHYR1_010565 [Brachionus plicatilis]|uniref:Uncharacterized protein n=1 Tax=Brachionus plicatilis TaxID=10195 RepID=A0A3M7PPU8_BRAPC|nr:hypothetical protein BpHYR1_010565 [Brachionus plicatilis]